MFLTRCRLLRKFLNFVFLRRKMYGGTSTEQKTKNAKNAVSLILTAFLKPHRQHFVLPLPLASMGGIIRLIIFGVFQELYRQSKTPKQMNFGVLLFVVVQNNFFCKFRERKIKINRAVVLRFVKLITHKILVDNFRVLSRTF